MRFFARLRIPDHLVVTTFLVARDYRVASIFCERHSSVGTVRQTLSLCRRCRGINSHDGIPSESRRIVFVHHGTPAEDGAQTVGCDSHGQMLPVDEVMARAVSPVHVAPNRSIGVVLKIQVIHRLYKTCRWGRSSIHKQEYDERLGDTSRRWWNRKRRSV